MSRISHEYADAFRSADVIVLTDIYSSGTSEIAGVTGHLVVDAVLERHPHAEVVWVENRSDLAVRVSELLESGDVCISMGCGDIETLPDEVLAVRRSAGET
jgi:UDP-N-acetylmuramate--alanine ligase